MSYYVTSIRNGPQSHIHYDAAAIMQALYDSGNLDSFTEVNYSPRYFTTHTRVSEAEDQAPHFTQYLNVQLSTLADKAAALLNVDDIDVHYYKFQVPKSSGGMRSISAPHPEMKQFQREVITFFQTHAKMKQHNDAFAYTQGRCHMDAVIRHQQNKSRWFLKLDIKDFFPSTDLDFLMRQLTQLYPLHFVDDRLLRTVLKACMLDGCLPQGSPASPILTNLLMIPFDHAISTKLWNYNKSRFIYTRYADDLIISNEYDFNHQSLAVMVQNLLTEMAMPYQIKREKTRYGSNAGRNWNLGLMLTQDNRITVGHKRKERMRASINNLFTDYKTGRLWPVEDLQVLIGNLMYINKIEPGYARDTISKYEQKLDVNFNELKKAILA